MLKTLKELKVRPGDRVRHNLPHSEPGDVYKVTHVSNSGQVYADPSLFRADPSLFRLDMTSPYWEVIERHRDRSPEGVKNFLQQINDLVVQNGYRGIVEIKVADADGFNVAWDATGKLVMNQHWRGEKDE